MAWHYGTFSCGHEGRVNITGPTKNRNWIAERKFEGKCEECYEKYLEEQREKANIEAAEKAKEMELPALIGTEKQVAWANTLRQKLIDIVEEKIKSIETRKVGNLDLAHNIFQFILTTKTDAKWFIDNRFEFKDIETLFEKVKKEIKTDEEIIEEKTELEVKAESTVKPESAVTETAVEITVNNDKISVKFEKNDSFREIVKKLGYRWNGVWRRNINSSTNGTIEDRAAELGNKLLNKGFPIMILDETIRSKAVKGEYEAECKRWIYKRTSGEYAGRLAIEWEGKNDKLYNTARKLPGSKWDNPYVVVKIKYYKEAEQFAEMYDFKFTKEAMAAIEEYKLAMNKVKTVMPVTVIEEKAKDGLKEILSSSTDILDDLMED